MAATVLAFALPSPATAAYLVPPGTSAATQYTEAYPTAGGPTDSESRRHSARRSPAKVLGADNAQRLTKEGRDGAATAALATATAPSPRVVTEEVSGQAGNPTGGAEEPGRNRLGGGAGGPREVVGRAAASSATTGASGDSGLGETIAGATGFSGGSLLPIALAATVVWLLAHTLRQRRRRTA